MSDLIIFPPAGGRSAFACWVANLEDFACRPEYRKRLIMGDYTKPDDLDDVTEDALDEAERLERDGEADDEWYDGPELD